jgi:hypothetical protein
MADQLLTSQLVGRWSHGVAHNCYGGSHDYVLVFLADGRGAFVHDGWWTYRYAAFRWRLDGATLVLSQQRYRMLQPGMSERRCLQVDGALSLMFDSKQQRERLNIPFIEEPNDFYLITREVRESDLMLEHLPDADPFVSCRPSTT